MGEKLRKVSDGIKKVGRGVAFTGVGMAMALGVGCDGQVQEKPPVEDVQPSQGEESTDSYANLDLSKDEQIAIREIKRLLDSLPEGKQMPEENLLANIRHHLRSYLDVRVDDILEGLDAKGILKELTNGYVLPDTEAVKGTDRI